MKQFTVILYCASIMFFSGCGGGEQKAVDIRAENSQNILKISIGMTKAEVMKIMGEKTARVSFGKNEVAVTNPYKRELIQTAKGMCEVLYYYTHQNQGDWPFKRFKIIDSELTPVVLQDGKVTGWGSEFLARISSDDTTPKKKSQEQTKNLTTIQCESCGHEMSKFEKAYIHDGHIVCAQCYLKLKQQP